MGKQARAFVTLVTVSAAAILLGACSAKAVTLTDSGFDTSCSTDDDCVGVYFGNVCGICATAVPNAAINSSAEGAYQSALSSALSQCPPSAENGSCAEAYTVTSCSMGKCELARCSGQPAGAHSCGPTSDGGDAGPD